MIVSLGPAAVRDLLGQSSWYEAQAGVKLARRWELSVETTLMKIAQRPRSGAPCEFLASKLRETRRLLIDSFPRHLVFYQIRSRQVVVLRILHGARDLEMLLRNAVY